MEIMTKKWKRNCDGSYGKSLAVEGRSGVTERRMKWEFEYEKKLKAQAFIGCLSHTKAGGPAGSSIPSTG